MPNIESCEVYAQTEGIFDSFFREPMLISLPLWLVKLAANKISGILPCLVKPSRCFDMSAFRLNDVFGKLIRGNGPGRVYRLATPEDEAALIAQQQAQEALQAENARWQAVRSAPPRAAGCRQVRKACGAFRAGATASRRG